LIEKAFFYKGLYLFSRIRFLTDITNSLLIEGANAVPIATRYTFREVDFYFFLFNWISTLAAITASLWGLAPAFRTLDEREYPVTMGALHLLLLRIQIFYKTFDIPFISPQFIKKFLGPFIREELI
jgi:hypothetical protein